MVNMGDWYSRSILPSSRFLAHAFQWKETTFSKLSCISGSEWFQLNSHTWNWESIMRQRLLFLLASMYTEEFPFSVQAPLLWVLRGRVLGICTVTATAVRRLDPGAGRCGSFFWCLPHIAGVYAWKQQLQGQLPDFPIFWLQLRVVLHCCFNTLKL